MVKWMATPRFQNTQAVHWLDSFGGARGSRDVHDYVARVLEGLVINIAMLRTDGTKDCCTAEESQRIGHELFDPVRDWVDEGMITGEHLEKQAFSRIDQGIDADERARIAYAYCYEAELAFDRGDVTATWTLVVDAMRVAAGVGALVVFQAGGAHGFSSRAKQAELASRDNPHKHELIEAKAEAHALWQERRACKHPKLRRNVDFARECVKRWPILSSNTITQKWCPQWEREEKKANQRREQR